MDFNQYFFRKEIQKSYRFQLVILDSGKHNPNGERMPFLQPYDVSNVSLPFYSFKKEIQKYGTFPKTFPVLDHDGFEITVTFEETKNQDVGKLVNWLQRKIIQDDGIYNPPSKNKIDSIDVHILNDMNDVMAIYSFPKCYFLRCQNVIYDYYSNEIVRCEVIFGADIGNVYFGGSGNAP